MWSNGWFSPLGLPSEPLQLACPSPQFPLCSKPLTSDWWVWCRNIPVSWLLMGTTWNWAPQASPELPGGLSQVARYETRLGIGIAPWLGLSLPDPISPLPTSFSWEHCLLDHFHMTLCLGVYIHRAKEHYQIIEKPCGFIASKKEKKNDLLHILNLKKSCKPLFFRKRIWREKKNIWRSSASPGSSQANTSAKLPMRPPRRMSNKSRSLWTVSMAGAGRGHVPRARSTSREFYRSC